MYGPTLARRRFPGAPRAASGRCALTAELRVFGSWLYRPSSSLVENKKRLFIAPAHAGKAGVASGVAKLNGQLE